VLTNEVLDTAIPTLSRELEPLPKRQQMPKRNRNFIAIHTSLETLSQRTIAPHRQQQSEHGGGGPSRNPAKFAPNRRRSGGGEGTGARAGGRLPCRSKPGPPWPPTHSHARKLPEATGMRGADRSPGQPAPARRSGDRGAEFGTDGERTGARARGRRTAAATLLLACVSPLFSFLLSLSSRFLSTTSVFFFVFLNLFSLSSLRLVRVARACGVRRRGWFFSLLLSRLGGRIGRYQIWFFLGRTSPRPTQPPGGLVASPLL
jgi:hypothetical protein